MISFSLLGSPTYGRLGNQLFQIAATIAIAKKNNHDFVFPTWDYNKYFEHVLPVGENVYAEKYFQKHKYFYEINLEKGNFDLRGFFSSAAFFEYAEADVRYYLTPKKEIINELKSKYVHLFSKKTCSIHIRRGDFLKFKLQYPLISDYFYETAMAHFDKDTVFVVFSDDINYCKSKFRGDKFVFIENEKDIVDMFLMSMCDNHIISNSTFSWWGAWLNQKDSKKIIAPKQWFGPGHAIQYKKISKEITKDFMTIQSNKQYNRIGAFVVYIQYHLKFFLLYKVKNIVPKHIREVLKARIIKSPFR